MMAIVAILLASTMYTLSAQTEQRNLPETQRRLDEARDLLLLRDAQRPASLPGPAAGTATRRGTT